MERIKLPSGRILYLSVTNNEDFNTRPKLKPTEKKAWCEELRSSKYQQCARALKDTTDPEAPKHCVLGVYCELRKFNHDGEYYEYDYKSFRHILPIEASDALQQVGAFIGYDIKVSEQAFPCKSLAALNDDGYDFIDLAYIIELLF